MPTNEGIVFPLGGYVPLKNIKCHDEEHKIWRGEAVECPGVKFKAKHVFFSREYLPEVNELDQILKEVPFDNSLIGVDFLLVPKEKLLFAYHEPGALYMPDASFLGQSKKHQM